MALRSKMVGWFDPPRLAATAIRVAISTVFGEFADRREALASAREIDPAAIDPAYDYQKEETSDFWFDFIADNGDGWNPTYAIARLLATSQLDVAGADELLPLARVVVMGGDQVYPTASREDYQAKLVAPFAEAARGQSWRPTPHLYAVPGNHDWYDGLSAFLGLFCRRRAATSWAVEREGRMLGGRRTQQTRSYFALALPHGWWLWGADIQLAGYIDQPQIDFFTHVAREWMEPGSRLIICTGQPSWAYIDTRNPEPAFTNFAYLASLADLAKRNHRLCVVLSGDSHHYSRFVEGDCQYITAGGGGAFLHPTHQLVEKEFDWKFPPPGVKPTGQAKYRRKILFGRNSETGQPAMFPDQKTSFRLTFRNLAFAALNWQYAATLGVACFFFAWLLQAQAKVLGSSLSATLAEPPSFIDSVYAYLGLLWVSPWPLVLVLAASSGYYYLADFPSYWRFVVGALHALVQAVAVLLASCLLARWMDGIATVWLILAIGVVGGVLAATILGLYFLVSLNLFGRHWNEAFSALRIEDYKCFLRLRIQPDGALRIYPVGLARVPRDDGSDPPRNPPLHPHLIEKPIEMR